jgi:hypothetical protein
LFAAPAVFARDQRIALWRFRFHMSRWAFMEMFALSKRAMGHFVFAARAASMKSLWDACGTLARTSS